MIVEFVRALATSQYVGGGFAVETFLLTWNPRRWSWDTLDNDLATYRSRGLWATAWSCGRRKAIHAGDRVFLLKQGPERPLGLFASGFLTSGAYMGRHFSQPRKKAIFVDVDFDVLLDPRCEVLPRKRLDVLPFSLVNWNTQSGGIQIDETVVAPLEDAWAEHVRRLGLSPLRREYDNGKTVRLFVEGRRVTVAASRLERSGAARRRCIDAKGVRCLVCDFDFEERYGRIGRGFIHVHHQDPLSERGGEGDTDPIEDLVPVCPNCHAMLHSSSPPKSVSALRQELRR